ncbi:hypothetical protein PMI21_01104 [Pseudomonas sp. GM18]|uniref:hypothetical protein n=1 Tax=Pseudomonas sp. GM18 TaxID=1144324 RepID=UPI00027265CB|nr:hypothetical protein [Pseudomonas sp. GM18]EJM20201.1 hypothetical protein PMI21_01104 [Pseudomonas sp. GM18]
MNTAQNIQPPVLGEVWPGQGGIYAGLMPARAGAPSYHMVIPADDIGRFEWGQYGDEAPATSLIDGRANTAALIESGGDYPAAKAAAAYTADGHADFYLPAAAELYEIWLNLNGKIEGWAWSSSQRSADFAFGMLFGVGGQGSFGKGGELRVRPVRRFPI